MQEKREEQNGLYFPGSLAIEKNRAFLSLLTGFLSRGTTSIRIVSFF